MSSSKDRWMLDRNRSKMWGSMGSIDLEASSLMAEIRGRNGSPMRQEQFNKRGRGRYQLQPQVGDMLDRACRGDAHAMDNLMYGRRSSGQGPVTYLQEPKVSDYFSDREDFPVSASKSQGHSLGPEFEPVLLDPMPHRIHEHAFIPEKTSRKQSLTFSKQVDRRPFTDEKTWLPESSARSLPKEERNLCHDACTSGEREVFRARLMMVGQYTAGKTSVKRSLMYDEFMGEHVTTDGVETQDQTCVVNIDTAVDWKKVDLSHRDDLTKEMARWVRTHDVPENEDIQEIRKAKSDNMDMEPKNLQKAVTGERPTEDTPPEVKRILDEMNIQAEVVNFKLPESKEEAMFNIWDFGGQHVYYTSHQTFLNNRAIYLLVMDASRPLDDKVREKEGDHRWKDKGAPNTPRDFLDFWLNSVHSHLIRRRQKDGDKETPPVLIVVTKTDLLHKVRKKRAAKAEEYIRSIRTHLEGKVFYRHVHDIIAVSNRDDEGIPSLRQAVVDVAKQQPYWGERRPIKWLLLMEELCKVRDSLQEKLMQYDKVLEKAKQLGMQKEDLRKFLSFHHNMGDLVYFDEEGISDLVILCPQWLGNVFRTVITQNQFLDRHKLPDDEQAKLKRGILLRETAVKLCGVTNAHTVISIMEEFDMLIACELDMDGRKAVPVYLVPCLLQKVAQNQLKLSNKVPCLHFKCAPFEHREMEDIDSMGFLPHGLYHRVISACCRVKKWKHFGKLIFYDYMVFGVQGFFFALYMAYNGITLSAFDFNEDAVKFSLKLSEIRQEIQSLIEQITGQVFPNLVCVPFLQCNCFKPSKSKLRSALGLVPKPMKISQPGFIAATQYEVATVPCSHRTNVDTKPWAVWFGDTEGLPKEGHDLWSQLQPHWSVLKNAMSYKVQDILVDNNLLCDDDLEKIRAEKTTHDENVTIYQILRNSGQDPAAVKAAVCEGLCQSSQYCPFAPPDRKQQPVSESQKEEIRTLRPGLREDIEMSPVLDRLVQARIVDTHIKEWITAAETRRQKVDRLLFFMARTHSVAHVQFIEILRETTESVFE